MTDKISGVAVVTGGGHGIGRALCRRLAADGATVIVVDIEEDAARTVAAEIGAVAQHLDVSDEAAMMRFVDDVETDIGPIAMFISNAGVAFGDGDSGAISKEGGLNPVADRWAACWNVNVMAQVYIWDDTTNREGRTENAIYLEHGKPVVFGKEKNKGVRMRGTDLEIIDLDGSIGPKDCLVWDEDRENPALATYQDRP